MRFRHPDGSVVHLAYCTNVHAAEDPEGVIDQLGRFAGPVREALDASLLGVGLWVAAPALDELLRDHARRGKLRSELERLRLEVVTLNGFPYRAFHAPVVKHSVYVPDWADPDRAAYTQGLVRLLLDLLPTDTEEGSISTLPLGWREGWSQARHDEAKRALEKVARSLAESAARTGRRVRLGLEPEPGCVVETLEQATAVLEEVDPEWIGLCLDTCHLAVGFEDAASAVQAAAAAGIPIVKAQLSCALRIERPYLPTETAVLESFVETRFLHQVRERTAAGTQGADDLDRALGGELPKQGEWRVHFHTPVHDGGGRSTQPELIETLAVLLGGPRPVTRHLEVETYTWSVLPADRRPAGEDGLVAGLVAELTWVRERLEELGLQEAP